MKIGIFIFGLSWGGATRRILTLARGFMDSGHEVKFFVVERGGILESEADGLEIEELSSLPVRMMLRRLSKKKKTDLSAFALAAALRRAERKGDIDILLSAANHCHIAAVRARLLSRTSIPLILRLSNHLSAGLKKSKKRSRRWRYVNSCRLYPRADGFIAVANSIAEDVSNATGIPLGNIDVIYNPTFTPDLVEKAAEKTGHPWLDKKGPDRPPVILGAGRLVAQKDFVTLIRAFALSLEHRDMRLVILGEGKQRGRLEALIRELALEDKADLPGFEPNPLSFMARADLFCLSSIYEGLPGVLIEAMATGTPVVSTDHPGGTTEVLEGGRYGLLVPAGDADAMCRAIVQALDKKWDRDAIKARAAEFTMDEAVPRYLASLERIYDKSGN